MIDFLWYTLKVSICLVVFYLFFVAVLKQSTFFKLNRAYLIICLLLSFTIPILKISIFTVQSPGMLSTVTSIISIEPESAFFQPQNIANGANTITFLMIISVIYLAGLSVLLFKLILSITKIFQIKSNSEVYRIGRCRIVKSNFDIPFSFLNIIFLPKNGSNSMILDHEMAHVKQFHYIDLFLFEIASIMLWFNPFVTLYKSSLKLQHEYLADSSVVNGDERLEDYLNCMLTQVKIVSAGGLTSQFYCKTIKKRIIMITKNKTSIKYFGVYLLALPLVCFMLLAFTSSNYKTHLNISNPIVVPTNESGPSIYPVNSEKITQVNGFGERMNPISKVMDFHYGIDFAAKEGEEIVVTADGVVVEAKFDKDKGMGNYILIKHNDSYSTFYSHLKSYTVKAGDVIKKGQEIGYVGKTGIATGSHLHYEVIKNGERVNPKDYLPK